MAKNSFTKRFTYVWHRDIRTMILREHLREMPREWYYIGEAWGGLIGVLLGWALKPIAFLTWPIRIFLWALWVALFRRSKVDIIMERQPAPDYRYRPRTDERGEE